MEKKLVNDNIYFDIINQVDEKILNVADELIKSNKVNIKKVLHDDENNFELHAEVDKQKIYLKVIDGEVENLSCTCDEYKETYSACRHVIAGVKEFVSNPNYVKIFGGKNESESVNDVAYSRKRVNKEDYKEYNQLLKTFYTTIVEDEESEEKPVEDKKKIRKGTIHIEPKIIYSRLNNKLKLEVKIGEKQLYKIKSFPEFFDRFINREVYKYGSSLEFLHERDAFLPEDRKLLDFIIEYAEIVKYANESTEGNGYEYYKNKIGEDFINISNSGLDNLFEILKNRVVQMVDEYGEENVLFVSNKPDIRFKISKSDEKEYKLTTNIDVYNYQIFEGKEKTYFLQDKKLYICSKKYEDNVLKIVEIFRKNFIKELIIPESELSNFFSIVEPNIKDYFYINEADEEEISKFIPATLSAKLFLDYDDSNNIIADVKFCYDDIEFNPLMEVKNEALLSRNLIKESKLLNMLLKSGFLLDQKNHRLIMINEDKIYEFLSAEIENYMNNFEVLATENFKTKEIKKSEHTSLGVRIENNLLDIDFSTIDFDLRELKDIMKKYRLKKHYHRLKDGSFIELTNNETIEFINDITENIDIDYSAIDAESKELKLPIYRSLYLNRILDKVENIKVKKDEDFKNLIEKLDNKELEDIELPKKLTAGLRNYQKVGFEWLTTLDQYNLGGILADDMGLGKTIQAIAVVCKYIESEKNPKPSLIVCPSSLSLNWMAEIEKFSEGLKAEVIHGTYEERVKQINNIPKNNIVITSYELLKRDIEEYEKHNYNFKFIFADEAQYIKNNNTKNAKAIKKITAETRFALTGTPIENSLSELWSIFDYIMPGYLFSYKKFKELYETPIVKEEDKKTTEKLKKLIEPFVLRRIKKEVLTELPDKMVTVLNSSMVEEQEDIYMSYLARAKKNAIEEINENGIEKSQIKILALLTRLRQICCHPGLFIENYKGESGKLSQCVEIIKDAIQGGHKILLFSGYTSMFEYIEKELKKENIEYLKLTGQTKVSDRLRLVDEFNNNENVKLFLISLKAGGTGINLTGADMVIHYDPWWNLSAENQATDRTYRIGQKRKVQVFKMITKNSIEEKIYDLQNRKEALIDNMLSTNQTFISKLSKEEIMSLFE